MTHALLNDPATELIMDSPIEYLFVTNTVVIKDEKLTKKIVVCSMGKTIAEAIRRVHNCESVSILF